MRHWLILSKIVKQTTYGTTNNQTGSRLIYIPNKTAFNKKKTEQSEYVLLFET